uniref:Proliferation-associated 2G4, b n=1 Tax=Eptatretus burgeri TaxID=7764 RepID=A0A8C4QLI4_EPTBU
EMAEEEAPEQTVAQDVVLTKYSMAAEAVNRALRFLITNAQPGQSIQELCEKGDNVINEETAKIFKKEKDLKKGVAFPTCISVNNCVCHFSPLRSEVEQTLKADDLVKIDLGAHVDGFIATVAHTLVVGASKVGHYRDAVINLHAWPFSFLPQNTSVTQTWNKIGSAFNCTPIEGMLSHQLKQHVIDGEKTIIQNPTDQQKKDHEKASFEVHEVYAVDVLVSTGDGKAKETGQRTTVYKRNPDKLYLLKMRASRIFISEITSRFDVMPFTLRAFEDEKKARMGLVECVKRELLQPFPVLYEKEGEFVAQFKFTVLLLPNGPLQITGGEHDTTLYHTDLELQDAELKVSSQGGRSGAGCNVMRGESTR